MLLCCCKPPTLGWALTMCGGVYQYPLPHILFTLYKSDGTEVATEDWNPSTNNDYIAGCNFDLPMVYPAEYYITATPDTGYHLEPVTSTTITISSYGSYNVTYYGPQSFANNLEAGYYCQYDGCCPPDPQCVTVCPPWKFPPEFTNGAFPNPLYINDGQGDVACYRTLPSSQWLGVASRNAALGYASCPDFTTCQGAACDPGVNVAVNVYLSLSCLDGYQNWFLGISLGGCPGVAGCIAAYPYIEIPQPYPCYSGGGGVTIALSQCDPVQGTGGATSFPSDYAISQIWPNGVNITVHE